MKSIIKRFSEGLLAFVDFAVLPIKATFEFLKTHKRFTLCLIFVLLAGFGYDIWNFSLSPDEERELVRAAGTNIDIVHLSLREGRYGGWIIKQILELDGIFTPGAEAFFATVFLGISAATWCLCIQSIADEQIGENHLIVFAVMFVTFPYVVAEVMSFGIANSIFSVQYFLIAASQYYLISFIRKRKKLYLLGAVLLAVFLFTYEGNVTIYVMSSAMLTFFYIFYRKKTSFTEAFSLILKFILIFALSMIICYGLKAVLRRYNNGYTTQFIRWSLDGSLTNQVIAVLRACKEYFNGDRWPGAGILLVGTCLSAAATVIFAIRKKSISGLYLFLVYLAVIVFSFSMVLVCGASMPVRTMRTLPLLSGFCWMVAVDSFRDKKRLAALLLVVSAFFCYRQVLYLNRIFTGSHLCSELDMEMGYKIGTDIQETIGARTSKKPVVFVGRYQHPAENIYRIDASGQSIFFRNNTIYKVFYLNYLGFSFVHANDAQIREAEEAAQYQPAYPMDGYIREYDDIIVVKLTGSQVKTNVLSQAEEKALLALPARDVQDAAACSYGWIGEDGIYVTCAGRNEDSRNAFSVSPASSQVEFHGWAADFLNGTALDSLYLCVGDRIFLCEYGIDRKDVANRFRNDELRYVGFSVSIPADLFPESEPVPVRFLMVAAGNDYVYPSAEYTVTEEAPG